MLSQTIGPASLIGELTVQSVELTNTTNSQTNRPENLPELFGSLNARFPIALEVHGVAEVDYVGDQFCIDPGTGADTELDAGTHLNAELARVFTFRPRGASWLSRVEARVAADNLTDTARYDQCGLPQPGRLLRFQLRLY
jgi:iron complex outermembrane receptor protein